ncbi:MAG TPA: DNA polymerase III subunit beta [Polyangiaceae bacterium]|nr:DNA polymerase III subunit beta [Polyangiaceae bacterium]
MTGKTAHSMQVTVSKKDLLRILDRCQGVADKKSTMPVLGNVLLDVDGPTQLRLSAMDLFLSITGRVQAQVERGGSIAVGARDLFERVRMMPEGQLTLSSNDGASLTLKAVGTARRFTIHGIPGDEFPKQPQPDSAAAVLSLPVSVLATLIQSTQFSISTDDSRLALNSALFEWTDDRVRIVTTDGHRLTKAEAVVPGTQATATMLIPLKGIQQLKRVCDDALAEAPRAEGAEQEPVVKISQAGPSAFFQMGSLQFSVKLVDAQFPPYDQVIPAVSERVVRAPRLGVADALKAVSVAANDRTGGVKLTLSQNAIRFETESPESGEGFDEIAIDYDGPDLTIGFNAKYFLDVTGAIVDDDISIGIGGELDPAVIRPATGSEAFDFLAVVMPMRI